MKTLLFITFLFLTQSLSSNELAWVDEQVNAIKPPRTGIKNSAISRLKDPFIFFKKKKSKKSSKSKKRVSNKKVASATNTRTLRKKVKKTLTLDAIMNHSALISGKWYKIDDKVGRYTLTNVDETSVVLSNKGKRLVLSTNSRNLNLKFKNK